MRELVDGFLHSAEFLMALGAVNYLVIAAGRRAGSRNNIFLYSSAGGMRELVDGLCNSADFLAALGAVGHLIIAARSRAGSRSTAHMYRLAGGMVVSNVKVVVRRLIVEVESLGEVLLLGFHFGALYNCLSVVERGEGKGGAAYGEGLLIIKLRRGDIRVVYIVIVAGQIAVIRACVGDFARVRGRGKVNAQGVL